MGQGQTDKCTKRHLSSYQKQINHVSILQRSLSLPSSRVQRDIELSQKGLFDCVKTPNNSLNTTQDSSGSVTSLFQSCRRPSEYDNEFNDPSLNNEYPYHRSNSAPPSASPSLASANNHSRTSLASGVSNASSSKLTFRDYTEEELNMPEGDEPTFESDLSRLRDYHVVTTAG
jgi:hypothetical protein